MVERMNNVSSSMKLVSITNQWSDDSPADELCEPCEPCEPCELLSSEFPLVYSTTCFLPAGKFVRLIFPVALFAFDWKSDIH